MYATLPGLLVRPASPITECRTLHSISNLINAALADKNKGWIWSSSMPLSKTFNLAYLLILCVQHRETLFMPYVFEDDSDPLVNVTWPQIPLTEAEHTIPLFGFRRMNISHFHWHNLSGHCSNQYILEAVLFILSCCKVFYFTGAIQHH